MDTIATKEEAANARLRQEAKHELAQFEVDEDRWKARRCTRPVSEGGCLPGKAVSCRYCGNAQAPVV